MSSDDVVILAEGLRKTYRLYARPWQRLLDLFGLLGAAPDVPEHVALDGVNLRIRRGEKVALIGRNGAGKSTLLKLVTGVINPTGGRLEVSGGAHALLQIGAGFHPDFSGRQNVLSYLAHLGVSGRLAEERVREVIEFAELEEYADQPIKTYSTGMVARLMFAASTVTEPDLLVLDEILGVGDSYFAQKSFERIREMCAGGRTTVLLVSHDIYSASKLCDRMIWLDAGRVMIDGDAAHVMKAYEDSIRVQEEARLVRKAQLRLEALRRANAAAPAARIDIRSRANAPMASALQVAEVSVRDGDQVRVADLGDEALAAAAALEGGTPARWGPLATRHGVPCREMLDHGTPLHRASLLVALPGGRPGEDDRREVGIRYRADSDSDMEMVLYGPDFRVDLGPLPPSRGEWTRHVVPLAGRGRLSLEPSDAVATAGVHGTGDVRVTAIRSIDDGGRESLFIRHGAPMSLEIDYEVRDPGLDAAADLLVGFHRDGVADVCRYFTRDLRFGPESGRSGTIVMRIPRVPLANGAYTVSLTLARAGYYAGNPTLFYSINPDVYACLSRFLEIEVHGGDPVASGAGVVGEAAWTLVPREPAGGAGEASR